ncbi:MAG: C10 family peptidase [Bacteroidota bacterium]
MKKIIKQPVIGLVFLLFSMTIGCSKKGNLETPLAGINSNNVHLVPESVAQDIAEKFNPGIFLKGTGRNGNKIGTDAISKKIFEGVPGIEHRNSISKMEKLTDRNGLTAFYAFSFEGKKGFVIVAGDSALRPILAYVPQGEFDGTKVSDHVKLWIKTTIDDVEVARQGLVDTRKQIRAWKGYINQMSPSETEGKTGYVTNGLPPPDDDPCADPNSTYFQENIIGPLLPTQWGQLDGFNDALANASCSTTINGRPPTGCVATAMAQIIRYWQSTRPTATYNYTSMSLNTGNSDVQGLMVDAGTSVNMGYTCSGSGPVIYPCYPSNHAQNIVNGFRGSVFNYQFGTYMTYNRAMDFLVPQGNIGAGRPVIFLGWDVSANAAHCWVADGVLDDIYSWCQDGTLVGVTYSYFHMNWGWNDYNVGSPTNENGWFSYSSWPTTNFTFHVDNMLIYDINP